MGNQPEQTTSGEYRPSERLQAAHTIDICKCC